MKSDFDAIICGSCVVDVLVRPVQLDVPIGGGRLVRTEPLRILPGGIVSNSGITMARLGMRVAAFTYVGQDEWGENIRARYQREGIDTRSLMIHPEAPSSTTAVLIDDSGERSFLHAVGAPKRLDKRVFLENLELFQKSRSMLLGYYPLLPDLEGDLPEVLAAIRKTGCQTALDAAGEGGTMQPLAECLPHLDYYIPSFREARHQTGESDPEQILNAYRSAGATGFLGVKLGTEGALLSPKLHELVAISPCPPPGEVVDTTGAGDCFYGALLAALLRGHTAEQAGRLAAAAGACCVTGLGATTAMADYAATCQLAGIS